LQILTSQSAPARHRSQCPTPLEKVSRDARSRFRLLGKVSSNDAGGRRREPITLKDRRDVSIQVPQFCERREHRQDDSIPLLLRQSRLRVTHSARTLPYAAVCPPDAHQLPTTGRHSTGRRRDECRPNAEDSGHRETPHHHADDRWQTPPFRTTTHDLRSARQAVVRRSPFGHRSAIASPSSIARKRTRIAAFSPISVLLLPGQANGSVLARRSRGGRSRSPHHRACQFSQYHRA
jgi:hypothetical protein